MFLTLTFGHMFKKAERLILISQHMSDVQKSEVVCPISEFIVCEGLVDVAERDLSWKRVILPRVDEMFVGLNMLPK